MLMSACMCVYLLYKGWQGVYTVIKLRDKKNNMKNTIYKMVGKKGTILAGGLKVEVEIKDVKNSYGRDRFLVSPIAGSGEVWVESVTVAE
jgi:hypothetical protein